MEGNRRTASVRYTTPQRSRRGVSEGRDNVANPNPPLSVVNGLPSSSCNANACTQPMASSNTVSSTNTTSAPGTAIQHTFQILSSEGISSNANIVGVNIQLTLGAAFGNDDIIYLPQQNGYSTSGGGCSASGGYDFECSLSTGLISDNNNGEISAVGSVGVSGPVFRETVGVYQQSTINTPLGNVTPFGSLEVSITTDSRILATAVLVSIPWVISNFPGAVIKPVWETPGLKF